MRILSGEICRRFNSCAKSIKLQKFEKLKIIPKKSPEGLKKDCEFVGNDEKCELFIIRVILAIFVKFAVFVEPFLGNLCSQAAH